MGYKIRKLEPNLSKYLLRHNLDRKWIKAKYLLERDLSHPSLHFKKIVLRGTVFYSFRLDKKYRGICILQEDDIEIILFTDHYK